MQHKVDKEHGHHMNKSRMYSKYEQEPHTVG